MRCSKCGAENLEGRKFCTQCGSPLAAKCPRCGAAAQPGEKFCGECGAALGTPPAGTGKSDEPQIRIVGTPAAENLDGERKIVTFLFADIKGSMELIEDLDPEEARAIIDPALQLMMEAVHHYGGHVAQSMGDGILALFGAPMAYEDHPQRALYAALRMQKELRTHADRLRLERGINLEIRVGANTGEVVVRSVRKDEARADYLPVGHSTGLAERMQSIARPGTIVVSEHTHKLCQGYFSFTALGPAKIKGLSEPLSVYEVTGIGPLRTRLQLSARRGLSKFVGRDAEMVALKRAFELTMSGKGQMVGVVGEPGVGKSRLFHEFKAINGSDCLILEAFSVSHGKASAYLPAIDFLRGYFEIESDDDERKKREKVTGKLLALDRALEEILPTIFALLAIADSRARSVTSLAADPETQRLRNCEAIRRLLIRESLNQPLIAVFEDLHWIDSETQALLDLLAESIGSTRILMLFNFRPEYRHQWSGKNDYLELKLNPLGEESAELMLAAALGHGSRELETLKREIIHKTRGNPFFIEEIIQSLYEQWVLSVDGATVRAARPFSEAKLPATVQALLASRIDRLPADGKELLQTLAVIGKEFPLGLVQRIVSKPQAELERMLSALQLAEFIYEQPAGPEPEYIFKHALTQEVAYNSVLLERRRVQHGRIAAEIEEMAKGRLDDSVADLAHHYSRSDNPLKAAHYLKLAAQQAAQRSAFVEAADLARRGIEMLKVVADTPERVRQEAELQITLAYNLLPSTPAAAEVGRTYTRARELAERIGDNRLVFAALDGLLTHYGVKGEGGPARELSRQLLTVAQQEQQPAMLAVAHGALALSLGWYGELELESAKIHGEESLAASVQEEQIDLIPRFGRAVPALSRALWALGYPNQAKRVSDDGVVEARAMNNPLAIALSLVQGWDLNRWLRDLVRGRQQAEAAIEIGQEYGILALRSAAAGFLGWVLVHQGRVEEGMEALRKFFQDREKMGMGMTPHLLGMVAEAHLEMRQPRAGLEAAEAAARSIDASDQRFYEAEVHRVKGELLLLDNASNSRLAAESFRKAIDVAKAQGAKSWELRATTSLARLLQRQGKREEARSPLAEIYNWFTEGFDTADLKDAKELLKELNS